MAPRLITAGLLLVLLLALQLPILPWQPAVTQALQDAGPYWRQILALGLVAGLGLALPRTGSTAPRPPAPTAHAMLLLGIGALLLLEPLLHLLLLVWAGQHAEPGLLALVLPPPTPSATALLWQVPLAVVLPAVIEEWAFRGRLFDLLRRSWGPGHACSLSTLVFAAVHATPTAILVSLPVGLLLALLRLGGAPVRICMLVHGTHNLLFLSVAGLAAMPRIPLLMVVCGAWLLSLGLAWRWFPHPRQQRRMLLGSSAVMFLALWLLPDHDRLQRDL
ncbi:MAG: CPBP family intramembrane glutamic endopeptidase, partial [Planctomycetota bacterium]